MAESVYTFHCLRCDNKYEGSYDPDDGPKEITCPQCRSNSVRRLPLKKDDKTEKK